MGAKSTDDPRLPFPFRVKKSLIEKAKKMGRDAVEKLIEDA